MKRRHFISLLGGAVVAYPLAARAQQRRIGVLMATFEGDPAGESRLATFRAELAKLGWTEGRNLRIDVRWASDSELARKYVTELVALAPVVILAATSPQVTALKQATRTVPIVFVNVVDPVGSGMVTSLARPGGNLTARP